MREASRARKRYIHIHFSIRKKQKPYYAKLKGIFYKVLRLRKKQSTPTTMKEKLKKHFLRKIGYWIITFFMIVEEVRVWTKRILKKIYKFFVTVRGVQHFFFIYFKYLRRHMWKNVLLLSINGLRLRKGVYFGEDFNDNFTYEVVRILRRKPVLVITARPWMGNKIWEDNPIPGAGAWKMYLRFKSPVYFKMTRRRNLISSRWSYKRSKSKRIYRRAIIRLSHGWGNMGRLHTVRYKKEKLMLKKETIVLGGRQFLKQSHKKILANRMKFDRARSFPMPRVKRNKRRFIDSIYVTWLNLGYIVLEKSKYLDLKFSAFAFSSFSLPVFRKTKAFGHPFHLVNPSVLPISLSFSFFAVIQDILSSIWLDVWYSQKYCTLGHVAMLGFFFGILLTWVLEVFSEEQSGAHTLEVQKGFQYAVLLFILSELMLFFSFFWAYFHFSLNSNSFTGGSYTPKGLVPFYWFRIPLLNTLLLLASGLSLTIAHILIVESDKFSKFLIWVNLMTHYRVSVWFRATDTGTRDFIYFNKKYRVDFLWFTKRLQFISNKFLGTRKRAWLIKNIGRRSYNHLYRLGRIAYDSQINLPKTFAVNFKSIPRETFWQANFWILDTVIKGFVFLIYQTYEYTSCMFSINDSVYGAVFFSLTGLHGIHVFIGVMFLFTVLNINLKKNFGKIYGSFKTWRRRLHMYVDRAARPRNAYKHQVWTHRVAFDGAAWYWHFVDVVWFFVFVFVYWWGFAVV